ncbi:SDR family oxidoreductase [Mariprofundus erugo]|uniref:SDR family NAD(P)-dependent oxidoreductase n=1 Tax=Mariprofundus erugo TaxID=2528639 RepID=UPI0010FED007|nr:SDR family oxidoreductase [Mariprofundus erugo]TLS78186.1 SDR family oxidoreductase [Mariprofundus erugo]
MNACAQKQIALIVGGSSGMGKAAAKRLLRQGYTVQILSSDSERLAVAKKELEAGEYGCVETICVNLYDTSAVHDFIALLYAEQRHIKYLVNAAGFFKPVTFLDHTEADYDLQMDINKTSWLPLKG